MQLYLPALTGRVALFLAHVFMLESIPNIAEAVGVGAQGQQPNKPEKEHSLSGCSSPQPGSCMVPRTGSHSQPVEGDNYLLH